MHEKAVTMYEVRETINHLVQGVDPYTGEVLDKIDFLQNPRMIRCFALMSDLSTRIIEKQVKKQMKERLTFRITKEDCEQIQLPKADCGVNAISGAINKVINQEMIKPLQGYQINHKLVQMGILSKEEGKNNRATVLNERSESYGITSVHVDKGDRTYDKIVFNKKAKAFIKDHLVEWFGGE